MSEQDSEYPERLGVLNDLTKDEVDVIRTAMYDYQMETERYLGSYAMNVTGHAECCEVAKATRARRIEEIASLKERLSTINAVLNRMSEPE